MTRTANIFVFVVLLGACSSSEEPTTISNDDPGPALVAVALQELVTNDHTFGSGPPPFTEYLIQSNIDPSAGTGTGSGSVRALTEDERSAIEAVIAPFGPVQWINDPGEFRTDNLIPTIEGSAILGVGEPTIDGDRALVPVSLWCGGLCGTWLTYDVELIEGIWQVTGSNGPIAIS